METWVFWILVAFGIVSTASIIGGIVAWYKKRSSNNSDNSSINEVYQPLVKEKSPRKQNKKKRSRKGKSKRSGKESKNIDPKEKNDKVTTSKKESTHNAAIPNSEENQPSSKEGQIQKNDLSTPAKQNKKKQIPQGAPKSNHIDSAGLNKETTLPKKISSQNDKESQPLIKEELSEQSHLIPPIKQQEEKRSSKCESRNSSYEESKRFHSKGLNDEIASFSIKFTQNTGITNYEESQPLGKKGQKKESHCIDTIKQDEKRRSSWGKPNNPDNSTGGNIIITPPENTFPHNAGIPNYGNTCYLNSTIQALACIPEFVNLVSKSNSDVFKCLSQIFALVLSNNSKNSFKPLIRALINALKQNYPMFTIMKQNDCKELYNILIDNFFTESEEKNLFLIKKTNLFICEKGHKSRNIDPQLFLVIPAFKKLDSEKCIQDIKENESILESICQECGETINTRMLTESLELPEYLVFYIADTTHQGRIPKTYIRADEKEYDLFGAICYYGDGKSGHYIAFTLNEDREWIKYNDADVNKEDPDYNHAYMLFYKQR